MEYDFHFRHAISPAETNYGYAEPIIVRIAIYNKVKNAKDEVTVFTEFDDLTTVVLNNEKIDLKTIYLNFLSSKGYNDLINDWYEIVPTDYAIIDINQDGKEELIVSGGQGFSGFYSFAIFGYDEENDSVFCYTYDTDDGVSGNLKDDDGLLQYYGSLSYSSKYKALMYSTTNDGINNHYFSYDSLKGKKIYTEFMLAMETEYDTKIQSYYVDNAKIDEATYNSYINELKPIEWTKIHSFESTNEETTSSEINISENISNNKDNHFNFKVGFIYLHDKNSTYDLNFMQSAKAACKKYGVQYIEKTNIPEGSECKTAAEELAQQGCKIIFANSFGHESFLLEAANAHPKVQFCHASGIMAHTENLSNFHNAYARSYEGRYLCGITAGMKLNEMISNGEINAKKAKLGYVATFEFAEVISDYTAFYLGAKSVCPAVTMEVQFTTSWYDTSKEKEAAEALIKRGCKVISQHADSLGAPSACEKARIPNISYNGSTLSSCPNTFIVSSSINWQPYFEYIIKCVGSNKKIDTDWCGGLKQNSIILSTVNNNAAAKGTMEAIEKAKSDIINGSIKVFNTDNFTVGGKKLTSYIADVNFDPSYNPDTEIVKNGYVHECEYRSAPYFDIRIDGIKLVNQGF